MKTSFAVWLEKLAGFTRRIFAGKSSVPVVRCQFCGKTGHMADDCPDAGKYKLFNVDNE
jgi:hypothetical protein